MKGLMFNLLDSMSRDAGCSEEAWELVLEFAAAERQLFGELEAPAGMSGEDALPPYAFDIPTEAMLKCLVQAGDAYSWETDLEMLDAQAMCFTDPPVPDPMQDLLLGSHYDALPRGFGFQAGAFLGGGFGESLDDAAEDDLGEDAPESLFPPGRPGR